MAKPRLRGTWRWLRNQVVARDGYRCVKCGARRRLEVDHIEPVEQGGTDAMSNLQTLCFSCHVTKTRHEAEVTWRGSEDWREFAHASRFERARPKTGSD